MTIQATNQSFFFVGLCSRQSLMASRFSIFGVFVIVSISFEWKLAEDEFWKGFLKRNFRIFNLFEVI